MDYLEFIARVTSHIPDKGQVMVRYYGLYANAHRGKVRKASLSPSALRMAEKEPKPVPSKGWAAIIRKVYEVDSMVYPRCGGPIKVIAFITEYAVVDRIIDHTKLTFAAAKPPPSHVFTEVALMEAEESGEADARAGKKDIPIGSQPVTVYVSREDGSAEPATVNLRATSESDPSKTATAAVNVSC
jgi:hypothetical protein